MFVYAFDYFLCVYMYACSCLFVCLFGYLTACMCTPVYVCVSVCLFVCTCILLFLLVSTFTVNFFLCTQFRGWWLELVWRDHGLREDQIQTQALDIMTNDYFLLYDINKDGFLQEHEYNKRPLKGMNSAPRKPDTRKLVDEL